MLQIIIWIFIKIQILFKFWILIIFLGFQIHFGNFRYLIAKLYHRKKKQVSI